jgi:hypothetical protein
MRVDWNQPICGLPARTAQGLLRYASEGTVGLSVANVEAMLHISTCKAKRLIEALVADGWLAKGRSNDWNPTLKGGGLINARRSPPIPIARGRDIARQAAELAAAINRSDAWSWQIDRVILFGSVLTGQDGDDVGDVDLVIECGRRDLPEAECERRRDHEEATAARSWWHYSTDRSVIRLTAGKEIILRQFRKLAPRYVSVNAEIEDPSWPHAVIYQRESAGEQNGPQS